MYYNVITKCCIVQYYHLDKQAKFYFRMRVKKRSPEEYDEVRAEVYKLYKQGWSCTRIDRKLRLSPGYSSKRIKNLHGMHDGRHFNKGSPKRKVTPGIKLAIKNILDKNPSSLQEVQSQLKEANNVSLTIITLKKVAVSLGFKYGTAKKRTQRATADKSKLIAFCRAHKDTNFKLWIFSDEIFVPLHEEARHFWYRPGSRSAAQEVESGPRLMVWIMIRFNKKPIYRIFKESESLTSELYTSTLEDHLLFSGHNAYTFLHYHTRAHSSRLTQQWFEEHHSRVADDYPPHASSHNINVAKDLLTSIKTQVREKSPETLKELEAEIRKVLESVTISTVNTLITSVPDRISAILASAER